MTFTLLLLAWSAALSAVIASDAFHESLTLHPLPDGKLSVLFEFTTYFSGTGRGGLTPTSHHSLTSPSLLLPLQQNNVSELSISFVSGQWDQRRSGSAGPLHYGSGGGGGEVRGWLRDSGSQKQMDENWVAVTNALGGLFCAGLQPEHQGDVVKTFGGIHPPSRASHINLSHYHVPHPEQQLCTENLTPFLALLPPKGVSGLSSLLAQPGIVLSWGFKAEGIEVMMPDPSTGGDGRWRGWWEGVVDLVPAAGGSRASSMEKLFRKRLPRAFPEAEESLLRIIKPHLEEAFRVEPQASKSEMQWIDGKAREVLEWELTSGDLAGQDVRFWWDNEHEFRYPMRVETPPITISRRMTAPFASDGTFIIRMTNAGPEDRRAVYSEVWPWWLKGWMSEVRVMLKGQDAIRDDLLTHLAYHASHPPHPSTTSLHFDLELPAGSTLVLSIPYTKLTIKYTEHRPDAERGVELPSGVLTLLDMEGEDAPAVAAGLLDRTLQPRRSGRTHIYTQRLLLDLPTPDFSMPYNVIIMSSTVMAVFFGLMQGALTRRWGFVEVLEGKAPARAVDGTPISRAEAPIAEKAGGASLPVDPPPSSPDQKRPSHVPQEDHGSTAIAVPEG